MPPPHRPGAAVARGGGGWDGGVLGLVSSSVEAMRMKLRLLRLLLQLHYWHTDAWRWLMYRSIPLQCDALSRWLMRRRIQAGQWQFNIGMRAYRPEYFSRKSR